MSDYGFTHHDRVITPNGTAVPPAENDARNTALEASELALWAQQPDRMMVYYAFPAEALPLFGRPRPYRATFDPVLHTYINASTPTDPGVAHVAHVSTWRGVRLGTITAAHVYRHNFGGRMVAVTVQGTNGATYYGRASYDNGNAITLHRRKQ